MKRESKGNIWAPMKGVWELDEDYADGDEFREGGLQTCIFLRYPSAKSKAPYELNQEQGIKLMKAFCNVASAEGLCKFLNKKGSLDKAEVEPPNSNFPYTNSLNSHLQIKPANDCYERCRIDYLAILELLNLAAYLKWLREFIADLKDYSMSPEKFSRHGCLSPEPSSQLERRIAGPRLLSFGHPDRKKLYDVDGRQVQGGYEIPRKVKCATIKDLLHTDSDFVIMKARIDAAGHLSSLAAQLTLEVGADFNPKFGAQNPRQAIFLAVINEAAKFSSIKRCECNRPDCSKFFEVGPNGKYRNTKYKTKRCRQSVYEQRQREAKSLAKDKK
jgi:hypothetical protein